jgi:hypothetical protein
MMPAMAPLRARPAIDERIVASARPPILKLPNLLNAVCLCCARNA